ncbi:MAG: type I restriction endonuclease subunit R, EcoR124 family, partial [Rectinemataceae bacterium]
WLVDPAPVVIERLKSAKAELQDFMKSQGLAARPDEVHNLRGDDAKTAFIKRFKEVQRLQTQLDQYTDLSATEKETIDTILPKDELYAFRGVYLETAQRLKALQDKPWEEKSEELDQLDFELVLFASATIDYDYIMRLIADFSTKKPGKATMNREGLIGLIASDAKFLDERQEITEYVRGLKAGEGLDEAAIRSCYQAFKDEKFARQLNTVAVSQGLSAASLRAFVEEILSRRIFDGEALTELLAPLELSWKERARKEEALMRELVPLLKKRSGGRDISGIRVYEE